MRTCDLLCVMMLLATSVPGAETNPPVNVALIPIEPGKFLMGSENGNPNEKPLHEVVLGHKFWMGKYEVTQDEYQKIMGTTPSRFKGTARPVETVSWEKAEKFCRKLTELGRQAGALPEGYEYRLPTEAEWEYCCRAGTTTDYYFGDDVAQIGDYEWTRDNSNDQTQDVGRKEPNKWGLFDMAGNVREWCMDWYGDYAPVAVTDPTGPKTGDKHVYRGGDWFYVAAEEANRSAHRFAHLPSYENYHVGFRVVLAPPIEVLQREQVERLKHMREQIRDLETHLERLNHLRAQARELERQLGATDSGGNSPGNAQSGQQELIHERSAKTTPLAESLRHE